MSKTVFISGASRGIGLALAERFVADGYHVIGTSRSGAISALNSVNFEVQKLDLSDRSSIENLDEWLQSRGGKLDILINNAGIGPDLDTFSPDENSFRTTFEVNVTGTVFLTELLCKRVITGGKIINISSKMGSVGACGSTDAVAYRMSKASLNMYTKILANRFLGEKLVAAVHPGWVRTTIAKSCAYGRLSPMESAEKIFGFATGDFQTGVFWNAETGSTIEW